MIRHLHDVAGLEPLQNIARELGVVIGATGDLARRLYTHELLTPSVPPPDLCELASFTTGIELVQSGGTASNDEVRRAIMRDLSLPECFRWTIRSAEQDARRRRASSYGPIVPVLGVRLSTRGGFEDPMNASADIFTKSYRFVRNPMYRQSPRFRANRDLEVFGAIAFLRAAIEAGLASADVQPALIALRDVYREARSWDTVSRLQQSAGLRGRLHRAVREVRVAASTIGGRELIDQSELSLFLGFLDGEDSPPPPPLATRPAATFARVDAPSESGRAPRARFVDDLEMDETRALTVSVRMRGDLARLPQHVELLRPDALASGTLGQVLQVISDQSVLAEGIELLRVSGWLRVMPGGPDTSADDDAEGNEMIHLAYIDARTDGTSLREQADEDVSALLLLRGGADRNDVLVAAPLATCVSRPYETPNGSSARLVTLRLACGSAIDRIVGPDDMATEIAFMVAVRRVEEPPPEDETGLPVTVVDHETMDSGQSMTMSPLRYKTQVGDPVVDPREARP